MATRYFGSTAENPQILTNSIVGASSGGTLAGGQVVQLVFDDTKFTSTIEGKQRLLAAVQMIEARLETAKSWPIDSSS